MLTLKAKPTFKAKVPIPVPGGETVEVEMEFKHRTKQELAEFVEKSVELSDEEAILQTVVGWEFKDKLDEKSVKLLTQNYHGAARAVARTYLFELSQVRAKN